MHDVLAPEGGGPPSASGAWVEAAGRVARQVLAPAAQEVDRAPVLPAAHLEALAGAGLFGLYGPQGPDTAGARAVYEVLAGACGVTFFVWVQHHAPVRLLAASPNGPLRERWLPPLLAGEVMGGVAFAHLRRPGPPAVAAHRTAGGWVFRGEAPWVTSWGLAGMFAVAALAGDGSVVFAAVPAGAGPALRPSPPLPLAVMGASATVRLGLDDLQVGDEEVIEVLSLDDWRRRDRLVTAQPNPAAFGVAATCLEHLAGLDEAAHAALRAEWEECRTRSYGRAGAGQGASAAPAAGVEEMVRLRAWSLDLAVRAAQALVVAGGGRSMQASAPAQRLLREAAFYAIQAQTPALRRATLDRLSRG